jgi:hypothetical protein
VSCVVCFTCSIGRACACVCGGACACECPTCSIWCACVRACRLHRGTTIRSVELYLTAFKEIRKDLREGTAPGADQKPRDQSSCHPYCLEIATIVHDPRSFGYIFDVPPPLPLQGSFFLARPSG